MTMARGSLPGDLQWTIDDMLTNRNEWWVPGKIVEIREALSPVWRNCPEPSSMRNLLLLDISLESFLRTRIEATTGGIDTMSGVQHTPQSQQCSAIHTIVCHMLVSCKFIALFIQACCLSFLGRAMAT